STRSGAICAQIAQIGLTKVGQSPALPCFDLRADDIDHARSRNDFDLVAASARSIERLVRKFGKYPPDPVVNEAAPRPGIVPDDVVGCSHVAMSSQHDAEGELLERMQRGPREIEQVFC